MTHLAPGKSLVSLRPLNCSSGPNGVKRFTLPDTVTFEAAFTFRFKIILEFSPFSRTHVLSGL